MLISRHETSNGLTIRKAADRDWPTVNKMLIAFADTTDYKYHEGVAMYNYANCVRHGFAIVIGEQPVGVMLANLGSPWFSQEIMSRELVTYVKPEYRGRWINPMLNHYERWLSKVKARGAVSCPDERMARVLQRRGYKRVENVFEVN